MKCHIIFAVVAAIAPLSLCQDVLVNPQLQQQVVVGQMSPYGDQISSSNIQSQSQSQAQAQAQAQAQSDSNTQQWQSYLNALQAGPSVAGIPGLQGVPIQGVPVLAGANIPAASSPLPAYNPYAAQDAISESLAETNLAAKIRQGSIQVVPPNLSSQAVLQSVHVPVEGQYSNRVYASQPLPPMVVSQPGSPPVQISSGPAAVVRAAPVIYKQPPSVVYQNEVINRHPAPLSLNPVYVKVYKPGKKVVAPRPVAAVPTY